MQETGWTPGSVWTRAENFAPTEIRSPDRLAQCFSTFVRPRTRKFFFFIKRGPSPNKFTRKYLSSFLSSYIKLTYVLIINYGIIIKNISTLMYMVWHVDKYKITLKLVINWTNEIL